MPPLERLHEGLGEWGRRYCVWTEGDCGSGSLTTGVVRHACRLRRDGTRGFWFRGIVSHAREWSFGAVPQEWV